MSEIKMIIKNIKSSQQKEVFFDNYKELKEYIATIKPSHFMNSTYSIDMSEDLIEFFRKEYAKEFFWVNRPLQKIFLNRMKSGYHRSKQKAKYSVNYEKTLSNTLERIKKDLKVEFDALDLCFDLNTVDDVTDKKRFTVIHIWYDCLNVANQKLGRVDIRFDKYLWTYRIIKINGSNIEEVMFIVKKVFEKQTKKLRNYRAKRKEKHENRAH